MTALKVWAQVIASLWKIVTGSTVAAFKVVYGILGVPKGVVQVLRNFAAYSQAIYNRVEPVARHLFAFKQVNIQTAADQATKWNKLNIARHSVSNIFARTWNLTIWVGTEISKHYYTWIIRPTTVLWDQLAEHWGFIINGFISLLPYGLFSYLLNDDTQTTWLTVVQDLLLYILSYVLVSLIVPRVNFSDLYSQNIRIVHGIVLTGFFIAVCYVEYTCLPQDATLQRNIVTLGTHLFCWQLVYSFVTSVVLRPKRSRPPPLKTKEAIQPLVLPHVVSRKVSPIIRRRFSSIRNIPRFRTFDGELVGGHIYPATPTSDPGAPISLHSFDYVQGVGNKSF